ncbi:MAG TPA: hypothetical protein PL182_13675, partial [Pseudobdellovibrionaceae bacterium]|nr:hypothetical protein [Pseudobdellovibrionaceae bacterium]
TAAATNDADAVKTANKTEEETPDLSAFLPSGNRLVGGVIAGLSGCRVPDPNNRQECAIYHGPSMNIWLKTKERFEELRFMRPGQFFMNEE